jgi:hypothetical protein
MEETNVLQMMIRINQLRIRVDFRRIRQDAWTEEAVVGAEHLLR